MHWRLIEWLRGEEIELEERNYHCNHSIIDTAVAAAVLQSVTNTAAVGIQKYRYHVTPASNSAHWAKIWPGARSSANSISDLQTLQIFCQKLFSFCVHRIMEVWVSEWSLIKLNITETVRIIRTYFWSDQNLNIVHCPHTDWSWIWEATLTIITDYLMKWSLRDE